MTYKILLHPKANKFLEKNEIVIRERIKNKLRVLKNFPDRKGNHLRYTTFWKLRIGDYRAIYEINNKEKKAIVLFIGHRKNVYDDFSRLF